MKVARWRNKNIAGRAKLVISVTGIENTTLHFLKIRWGQAVTCIDAVEIAISGIVGSLWFLDH